MSCLGAHTRRSLHRPPPGATARPWSGTTPQHRRRFECRPPWPSSTTAAHARWPKDRSRAIAIASITLARRSRSMFEMPLQWLRYPTCAASGPLHPADTLRACISSPSPPAAAPGLRR